MLFMNPIGITMSQKSLLFVIVFVSLHVHIQSFLFIILVKFVRCSLNSSYLYRTKKCHWYISSYSPRNLSVVL